MKIFTYPSVILFTDSSIIIRGKRVFLKRPAREAKSGRKIILPHSTFAVISLITELIPWLVAVNGRLWPFASNGNLLQKGIIVDLS